MPVTAATLYRIAEAAQASDGPDAFLAAVHRIVGELIDCPRFFVALLEDDEDCLQFAYAVDPGRGTPPSTHRLGNGLFEHVLRIGRPLRIDRADPALRAQLEALQACGELGPLDADCHAWLGVPLVCGDRSIGVLALRSDAAGVAFGAREQQVLSAVSYPIALGIERQRRIVALRRANIDLQQRVRELEALLQARLAPGMAVVD